LALVAGTCKLIHDSATKCIFPNALEANLLNCKNLDGDGSCKWLDKYNVKHDAIIVWDEKVQSDCAELKEDGKYLAKAALKAKTK
jgi:hypothetical protein